MDGKVSPLAQQPAGDRYAEIFNLGERDRMAEGNAYCDNNRIEGGDVVDHQARAALPRDVLETFGFDLAESWHDRAQQWMQPATVSIEYRLPCEVFFYAQFVRHLRNRFVSASGLAFAFSARAADVIELANWCLQGFDFVRVQLVPGAFAQCAQAQPSNVRADEAHDRVA